VAERRSAIVTGASRGIGRAIALALAGEDFNVVINYATNTAAAEEAAQLAQAAGAGVLIVKADISSAVDRAALIEQAWNRFGRIDLLVNNAGVAPSQRTDLLDASESSFDRVIATNLKGPYFLTQLAAKRMMEQNGGGSGCRIVIIGSVSAYAPSINRGEYCVAKAGLAMMNKLFAVRLADAGINVYEIRPGVIETEMTAPVKAIYDRLIVDQGLTPIRRWGQPQDVAKAVVAVARDLFPFSTGQVIDVDGGYHLHKL
jgi:NAD(P)-dependent dehydrogenase (short-subunit alcohol dehydrogenase family)